MIEIVNILDYYTQNKLVLDSSTLMNIVLIFLQENKISCNLNNIIYENFDHLGCYNTVSKIIYLNINQICQQAQIISNNQGIDYVDCCNELILITLFHELNHAIRLPLQPGNNVVDRINYYTWNMPRGNNHYLENGKYLPEERQATVFAYEVCLYIYQFLNYYRDMKGIINHLYKQYMRLLTNGYCSFMGLNNPLKKLLLNPKYTNIGYYRDYLEIEKDIFMNEVDLYERLKYGFPITKLEENYICDILDIVNHYQQSCDLNIKNLILRR